METVWPVRIAGYCTLRGILRRLINRIGTFDNQIGKDKLQRAENNIFLSEDLVKNIVEHYRNLIYSYGPCHRRYLKLRTVFGQH